MNSKRFCTHIWAFNKENIGTIQFDSSNVRQVPRLISKFLPINPLDI